MYLVASIRLSVRLSVCPSVNALGFAECSKEQRRSHQSKEFICVSSSRADAVDRLLMSCEDVTGKLAKTVYDQ